MAIILYPAELFNEKFLIKIRDCVLKLEDGHPVKRWLNSVAKTVPPTDDEVRAQAFLSDLINSQFNLITDASTKSKIIEIISDISDNTIAEKILKSFLYLMIGNITRSDNILGAVIKKEPVENWKGFRPRHSFYHRFTEANLEQIFRKFSKHPADRRVFQLFTEYLKVFFNDSILIRITSEYGDSTLEGKLDLTFVEKNAPELVHFLRLKNLDENRRLARLHDERKYLLKEQVYWYWMFFDVQPQVSKKLLEALNQIQITDPLWFIYVMENERLLDQYLKESGKSFISGSRKTLRDLLNDRELFMLALFKLIEFGDIDKTLIEKIVLFFTHE